MINKINSIPSFGSKVHVVYDNDFSVRDFYSSPIVKEQLDWISSDRRKNTSVTLLPIKGRYNQRPAMAVQVVQNFDNVAAIYNTRLAYYPEDIHSAYMGALEYDGHKDVRDNVKIMDYIV